MAYNKRTSKITGMEEKQYMPVYENAANLAPWFGTNTKNPGEFDLLPLDIPTDKKIDITEVVVKPIVQQIEEDKYKISLMKQKPELFEAIALILASFYILKMMFGVNPSDEFY